MRTFGGLSIIGSERHESRRIDRQLRGRSGRQGDPGQSRFFLSLEDELWRLFGDKANRFLGGWTEDQPLEAKLLTMAIERAQKKVEEHNFGIRKHTLEYDDVMNVQRKTIDQQQQPFEDDAMPRLLLFFFFFFFFFFFTFNSSSADGPLGPVTMWGLRSAAPWRLVAPRI